MAFLGPNHHVIFKAQLSAAAEVELMPLVHSEETIDAPLLQLRNHEIRGKTAVPQNDLVALEPVQQSAKQSQLARLLPLVGA